MKNTILHIIIIIFSPLTLVGQINDGKIENLSKISSINKAVAKINLNEKEFNEGLAEGPIIYKNIFRKNGGWTAYYLYDKQNHKQPVRIRYNRTLKRGYEKFQFYYKNGKLIFAKLTEIKNRGKNKKTEINRLFYFEDYNLIYTPELEKQKYSKYIKITEKGVREMLYE